jgi:hypothetical protein
MDDCELDPRICPRATLGRYGDVAHWQPAERALLRRISPHVAHLYRVKLGRALPLCPGTSDVDLFSYCQGIVDLDAKVTHGAFDLRMAEQQLYSTKIPRAAIDESRFRAAKRIGTKLQWI